MKKLGERFKIMIAPSKLIIMEIKSASSFVRLTDFQKSTACVNKLWTYEKLHGVMIFKWFYQKVKLLLDETVQYQDSSFDVNRMILLYF